MAIPKLLQFVDDDTDLIVLANPNSPIGDYKTIDEIKPLLDTGIPVLIDEAYIEFLDTEDLYITFSPGKHSMIKSSCKLFDGTADELRESSLKKYLKSFDNDN